jgi:hypothetical protein
VNVLWYYNFFFSFFGDVVRVLSFVVVWFGCLKQTQDLFDGGITEMGETCSSLEIEINNQKSVLFYTDIIIP